MCGIAGYIDYKKRGSEALLQNMHNVMQHRGPDGFGSQVFQSSGGEVGFTHRRLSIIDLSECGRQPMQYKQYSISFNGEVYNYAEIKATLLTKGHQFASHTDTEVILHAFEEWGVEMVHRFIGMFAFAIYDEQKKEVFIFRDRAGVKPLYYYWKDDLFIFGSELKSFGQHPAFEKAINTEALQLYLQYGYIKAPHTIFHNCFKLLPGHYLHFSIEQKSFNLVKYWDVADYFAQPVLKIDEEEAITETEKLLTSAFQYRMVADVPVGVFLSGGYDSSIVTALLQKNNAQKIKTFTIGFHDAKFNEAQYAKAIADYLGTDHHEHYCTSQEAKDIIPQLPFYFDEPFGDSSAIPTILVSRFARQQVTVALSADGGDELFAGYNRYDQLTQVKKLKDKLPGAATRLASLVLHTAFNGGRSKKSLRFQKLGEVLKSGNMDESSDFLSRHFTGGQLGKLLPSGYQSSLRLMEPSLNGNNDFLRSLLLADYKTYMVDDILTKVDRATMSVSLEGREPLLDHRIAEWAARLPSQLKYNNGVKKYLLKKITWKHLPKEMMERPKSGFGVPVNDWLRTDLKAMVMDELNETTLAQHGLLNVKEVCNIRDSHLNGDRNDQQLWLLLMFQMWWKQWMQ